jgi:hypothetical protein
MLTTSRVGEIEMEFLLNDLSFHGQFASLGDFNAAIDRLMSMRNVARSFGRELYCHRGLTLVSVMHNMTMQQAVASLPMDKKRAILSWMTKSGPFWEDGREHSSNEYLEHCGSVVTDTALGEVAWRQKHGVERGMVSLNPSNWLFSPISVDWVADEGVKQTIQVVNYWNDALFESALEQAPLPLRSWQDLKERAESRCKNLTFAHDAFAPLDNTPFVFNAAGQLLLRLEKLDRFKVCFDENGQRTAEGNEIYQDFFTGSKGGGGRGSWFSDSSESEKNNFKKELTFKQPADATQTLFCPWHGKVQTPQLRIHFSYPVRADEPLYIVYVGPKRTKR